MRAVYRYCPGSSSRRSSSRSASPGYGAFDGRADIDDNGSVDEDSSRTASALHMGFGYLVILLGLILLIVALVARHRIKHSAILFGLLVLQFVLAWPAMGWRHSASSTPSTPS